MFSGTLIQRKFQHFQSVYLIVCVCVYDLILSIQMAVPNSLRRIHSINRHNRAERTNSDISCKRLSLFLSVLLYLFSFPVSVSDLSICLSLSVSVCLFPSICLSQSIVLIRISCFSESDLHTETNEPKTRVTRHNSKCAHVYILHCIF